MRRAVDTAAIHAPTTPRCPPDDALAARKLLTWDDMEPQVIGERHAVCGTKIAYRSWEPATRARPSSSPAGLAVYGGRYRHVAECSPRPAAVVI
jgi:hypothetical protein